jgi:hypothetical protein
MPFVAVSIVFFFSMLGVAIDMMTDFQAVNQLEFAAQSAAFYGLSLATGTDSSYTLQASETRVQNAIVNNTPLWNYAPAGPKNSQALVPFTLQNIAFVPNPVEAAGINQEYFLQVTGVRSGTNAITHFFLPLLYVGFNRVGVPAGVSTMSPFRMVEVIGQPATRIGAGVPLTAITTARAADLVGFAAFPFALNYNQFQLYAQSGQVPLSQPPYTIDLVSTFTSSAQANHIQGAFVDVSSNPGGSTGFGGAGTSATLQSLLSYFANNPSTSVPPAAVETGSQLASFTLPTVNQTSVIQALALVLKQNGANYDYMLPVLQNNVVVGFARARLSATYNKTNTSIATMSLLLDYSVPCRNASSAIGYSANPATLGKLMPAPPAAPSPFSPRTADPATTNVSARPVGVVLAPALSPRILPNPNRPPTP